MIQAFLASCTQHSVFITQHIALLLPLYFIMLWLIVTTLLGAFSGWFRLAKRFPNRDEPAFLCIRHASGLIGGLVGMNGILKFEVCHSGLRVGIMRVFGPFSKDFFVPFGSVAVTRGRFLMRRYAKLAFGKPEIGTLRISAGLANRLASAAGQQWPERGPFIEETRREIIHVLVLQWMILTSAAAAFFRIAPAIATHTQSHPPLAADILFPAVVIGLMSLYQYLRKQS